MKRNIEKQLQSWRNDRARMPLLVRGARQVGKSFTVEKFGREFFESCVTINFDLYPHYVGAFDDTLELVAHELSTSVTVPWT